MIGTSCVTNETVKESLRGTLLRMFHREYCVARHFILDLQLVSGLYRAMVRSGNRNRVMCVVASFSLVVAAVASSVFIWMTNGSMPQRAIPNVLANGMIKYFHGNRDKR